MSFSSLFPCAIIGIGLIGSSIARAVEALPQGASYALRLYDKSAAVRDKARQVGLKTVVETLEEALEGAKLVIVAVPVGAYRSVATDMRPFLPRDAIVTDVGSIKKEVSQIFKQEIPHSERVIMGHPVAGTEYSGPAAGRADLFQNRWVILTPFAETDEDLLDKLILFWQTLGANLETMTPEHHDRVLAITSHIPHLIAYNIVGTASDLETVSETEIIKYSAGGFRDFTRIAASDPVMWRDIFLNNREATLEMLGRFSEDLAALQRAIRWGDGQALYDLFSRARAIRRAIIDAGQETDVEDFGRPHG